MTKNLKGLKKFSGISLVILAYLVYLFYSPSIDAYFANSVFHLNHTGASAKWLLQLNLLRKILINEGFVWLLVWFIFKDKGISQFYAKISLAYIVITFLVKLTGVITKAAFINQLGIFMHQTATNLVWPAFVIGALYLIKQNNTGIAS